MPDAPEQPNPVVLIDASYASAPGPHPFASLAQVFRVDGKTIRVRMYAAYTSHQSYAVAEVLTPALTWTEICVSPPVDWRGSVDLGTEGVRSVLETHAEKLLMRAAKILDQ